MIATDSAGIVQLSDVITWITSLLGVGFLGGLIGYWYKDKLDRNAENKRKIREEKERQYRDFLNNLMGFFKGWEHWGGVSGKDRKKQFIWDLHTNAPLYASDEIIKLANEYLESFELDNPKPTKQRDKIYAKLVLAIRRELFSISDQKTQLSEDDIKIKMLNE